MNKRLGGLKISFCDERHLACSNQNIDSLYCSNHSYSLILGID